MSASDTPVALKSARNKSRIEGARPAPSRSQYLTILMTSLSWPADNAAGFHRLRLEVQMHHAEQAADDEETGLRRVEVRIVREAGLLQESVRVKIGQRPLL